MLNTHCSLRFLAAGVVLSMGIAASAQTFYRVVELGSSTASKINNSDFVIFGSAQVLDPATSTVFTLPNLGSATRSLTALNNGQIATGRARTTSSAGSQRAVRFDVLTSTAQTLGTLGERSEGLGINTAGTIVGSARTSSTSSSQRAVRYESTGAAFNLATGTANSASVANDINDNNQIVGAGRLLGDTADQPLVYNFLGGATKLPVLAGTDRGEANALNNLGFAVGRSSNLTSDTRRASIWDLSTGTVSELLKPVGNLSGTEAYDINNSGVAVGSTIIRNIDPIAVVWQTSQGLLLNDLAIDVPDGIKFRTCTGINDSGHIVVSSLIGESTLRSFLLIPDNEFSSVSGTLTLQDLSSTANYPIPAVVEIRNPGTLDIVRTTSAWVRPDGSYQFQTKLQGTYDIAFKGVSWLRKVVPNVTLSHSAPTTVDASLPNGDVDNDNQVTIFDYIEISDAFDATTADLNYNEAADLDRDEVITIFDYIILSSNFDLLGDE